MKQLTSLAIMISMFSFFFYVPEAHAVNTYSLRCDNANASDDQYATHAYDADFAVDDGWTVEYWFKIVTNNYVYWAGQRSGENGWAGAEWLDSPDWRVIAQSGPTFGNPANLFSSVVTENEWTHVAIYFNNTTSVVYINGSPQDNPVSIKAITPPTIQMVICGSPNGPTGGQPDGYIDELRIWNDERTSTEIADNYDSELVGDEAGLKMYLKFENDLSDETGNVTDFTGFNSIGYSTDVPFPLAGGDSGFEDIIIISQYFNERREIKVC